MSEATQLQIEFEKNLVAGYNTCAVTREQYASSGNKLLRLNAIARQIDSLLSQNKDLSESDKTALQALTSEFIDATRSLDKR
jgi:hypothetical protein